MRTAAILPVKTFARAKQRLGAAVDAPDRSVLAAAMVGDVLAALAAVPGLDDVVVVTAEERGAGAPPAGGQPGRGTPPRSPPARASSTAWPTRSRPASRRPRSSASRRRPPAAPRACSSS